MIKFYLDPPSGHSDSYLDVRFVANFPKADKAQIQLFNDTADQPLQIVAIAQGYILKDTTAVISNSSSLQGFINVFNRDKMNAGLNDFVSVDIRCKLTLENDGKIEEHEKIFTFYNESKSLDGQIIPFEISLDTHEIDVDNNRPFQIKVTCGSERRFELAIRSEDGISHCTFEVVTKPGVTSIDIPCEVIFWDAGVYRAHMKKYDIYWVKFEGIDYQRFMNRKYIKIDNTRLRFTNKRMMPKPQERRGPSGSQLSSKFVLSDRYFVHTWKDFTSFGKRNQTDPPRLKRLTMFMFESQSMHVAPKKEIPVKDTKVTPFAQAARHDLLRNKKLSSVPGFISSPEKKFLGNFTEVYAKRAVDAIAQGSTQTKVQSFGVSQKSRSGGCGCSRNK